MAQKITIAVEDDLDGGPADETVQFGIGGTDYQIDLSARNAEAFRRKLAPFTNHARTTGRAQRRPARAPAARHHSGDIRSWAKEQGIAISDRGRIPAGIAARYNAATRQS